MSEDSYGGKAFRIYIAPDSPYEDPREARRLSEKICNAGHTVKFRAGGREVTMREGEEIMDLPTRDNVGYWIRTMDKAGTNLVPLILQKVYGLACFDAKMSDQEIFDVVRPKILNISFSEYVDPDITDLFKYWNYYDFVSHAEDVIEGYPRAGYISVARWMKSNRKDVVDTTYVALIAEAAGDGLVSSRVEADFPSAYVRASRSADYFAIVVNSEFSEALMSLINREKPKTSGPSKPSPSVKTGYVLNKP